MKHNREDDEVTITMSYLQFHTLYRSLSMNHDHILKNHLEDPLNNDLDEGKISDFFEETFSELKEIYNTI